MKKLYKFMFVAVLVIAATPFFGQNPTIITNLEQGLVLETYDNKYVVRYQAPKYSLVYDTIERVIPYRCPNVINSDLTIDIPIGSYVYNMFTDNVFKKIHFDWGDYNTLDSVGMPELPYRNMELVLPCSNVGSINVTINDIHTEKVDMDKPYIPKVNIFERIRPYKVFLCPYYKTDGAGFFDKWYYKSDVYGFLGTNGFSFQIFPIKYNPEDNYVEIIKSAVFTIEIDSCPKSIGKFIIDYTQTSHYGNEMHFYDSFEGQEWKIDNANKGRYVILTPPKYLSEVDYFATYKSSIGYDVSVYTVANANYANVRNNSTDIRNFLRNLYLNDQTRPRFVLLVGKPNTDIAPSYGKNNSESYPMSDLYYSCLEKPTVDKEKKLCHNLKPELYVGRWSVDDIDEVSNIIEKTIRTENALYHTSLSDRHIAMFSGIGDGEKKFFKNLKSIKETLDQRNFPNTLYDGRSGMTMQHMISELRGDLGGIPFMFVYRGHGNTSLLGDPYWYFNTDIRELNNSNLPRFAFGFGFACATIDFLNDNFGEGFTADYENGGVTYFGATVNSERGANNSCAKKIFKRLKKSDNFHIAEFTSWGMVDYYGHTTNSRRHVEKYNLFGDPSLKIYGIDINTGAVGHRYPQINTNVTKSDNINDIRIYPTFAQNEIFVESGEYYVNSVVIMDITGKIVLSLGNTSKIDVTSIPNGVYFIEIKDNRNNKLTTKIIINH